METTCPLEKTLMILGKKWTLQIIKAILYGKQRFSEIEEEIPGISARMLSLRLKELEEQHIIKRYIEQKSPIIVKYEPTKKGMHLHRVIFEVARFSFADQPDKFNNYNELHKELQKSCSSSFPLTGK